MIKIIVTREFRPKRRIKEYALSLALSYCVILYIGFSFPFSAAKVISCLIIALFITLSLTLFHRSKAERRIVIGPMGIKLSKGRQFILIPWSIVSRVEELWTGYGNERHRRFYVATTFGDKLELLRDGEYENTDAVISAIANYKRETAVN